MERQPTKEQLDICHDIVARVLRRSLKEGKIKIEKEIES